MAVTFNAESLRAGLAPISDCPLFCTWKLEPNPDKPDKPRKVPYVRGGAKLTGSYADPKLSEKLMPLEDAISECARLSHAGIGLVFSPGCGVVGLDLDHCIDPVAGWTLTQEQKTALNLFKASGFTEVSQSSTGLHVIALGDAVTHKANGTVELFGSKNFLALTGSRGRGEVRQMPPESIAGVTAVIDQLKDKQKPTTTGNVVPFPVPSTSERAAAAAINADVLIHPSEAPDSERANSALQSIHSPADYDDWNKLVWAHQAAGGTLNAIIAHSLPDSEDAIHRIRDSFDPARPGGIGAATLYKMAIDAGWKDPKRKVVTAAVAGDAAQPSALDADQPTDIWLAKKFAERFGSQFKFDHGWNAWRTWRNGSWTPCTRGEQVEAAKQLAGLILIKAGELHQQDPHSGKTKRLLACAQRAQSRSGIDAALKLAQSDPLVAVSAEDFDNDPDLFNVANGVVHLPTGQLRPHDPTLMLFRQSPVEYDAHAVCPLFENFMREISCDDSDWVDYLQRVMGYAMSGHVSEEKMFFWLGIGANGKSVLGNIQGRLMGSYGGVAPAAFLMYRRGGDANGPTPDIANLAGKRVVAANEVEAGSNVSGQILKTTTSTEPITARGLHSPPFTFQPTHKLFVRGNHKPIISDNDEGIWRRIDLIPFDLNLPPERRDQGLEGRLLGEAPGILAWMIRGFAKWKREGLRPARKVRDASLLYRQESDLLAQWVADNCEVGQDTKGIFTALQARAYANYRGWCHDQGLRQFSKKSFTRGLTEQGFNQARMSVGQRETTYVGFRLSGA